jgi:MFS family permease
MGARLTASIAAISLALFLLLLSQSPSLVSWISGLTGISFTTVALVTVVIGFFGIRFFGQGIITIVSRGMVARWFNSRRGFVVGIMGVATAFGFSYAPQPLQQLIQRFGWDGALLTLSLLLALVFLPIVLIFFRSDPDSCGMQIEEGLAPRTGKQHAYALDAVHELTVDEAKKRPDYWLIMAMIGYWTLFNTAFTFHIVSIFGEVGFTASEAVQIFLPISVISVVAQFIGSYASDRISLKILYGVFGVFMLIASVSLAWIHLPSARYLAIVGYGVSNGLFSMLQIVTWPKLYGRRHLGAVSGFAMSIAVAGSAVGPWLFSLVYQVTGAYRNAGIAGVGVTLLLIVLVIKIRFAPAVKTTDA